MRRLAAFTVLTILCLSIAAAANAWTVQDCEAVNYDHPDCDQYPTTTTTYGDNNPCDEYHESRHPECQTTTTYPTTTQPEVTTTTEPEVTTTTSNNTTTTAEVQETTTTTAAPCAPGLIHQPPLCVSPSTTLAPTETVPTPTTPAGKETLPFTGSSTGRLALAAAAFAVLGFGMVRKGRTG